MATFKSGQTYVWHYDYGAWPTELPKPKSETEKVAEALRDGDIFKVTRTYQVRRRSGNNYEVFDVAQPNFIHTMHQSGMTNGSAKVELVKKAKARQRQSFKVGDVINADTLREVQWVRGTVIERDDNEHAAFVLRADGRWHDLIGNHQLVHGWPFEAFSGNYRLSRLPK